MTKRNIFIIIFAIILIGAMSVYALNSVENQNNDLDDNEAKDIEINQGNDENQNENEPITLTPIDIGQEAPNFTLENLQGEKVSLKDYRGKNVLINFWTTTCPYCIKEMPDFKKYYEECKDEDFTILAINGGEEKRRVERFVKENGYEFPVLLDMYGVVARQYMVRGVPTSIIVDNEGIIRGVRLGPMTYPEIKQRFDAIKGQ